MKKILVFELEPAPYKVDLWNYISDEIETDVKVNFSERKDVSIDAGHKFSEFPAARYETLNFYDFNLFSRVILLLSLIYRNKGELFVIIGYHKLWNLLIAVSAIFLRIDYLVFIDKVRELEKSRLRDKFVSVIRNIVLGQSLAVLTCGKQNAEYTFKTIFRRSIRVEPFNYYVDANAYRNSPIDRELEEVIDCQRAEKKKIILFSGRMIARKGLKSLIDALATMDAKTKYFLVCEGDGHSFDSLKDYANGKLAENVFFTGFLDYQKHRYLINSVDIVVVPSLEDNWGIVVSEGALLNKVVIASDAVGSVNEFMNLDGHFVYKAGDVGRLKYCLSEAMTYSKPLRFQNYEWPNAHTLRKFV